MLAPRMSEEYPGFPKLVQIRLLPIPKIIEIEIVAKTKCFYIMINVQYAQKLIKPAVK